MTIFDPRDVWPDGIRPPLGHPSCPCHCHVVPGVHHFTDCCAPYRQGAERHDDPPFGVIGSEPD